MKIYKEYLDGEKILVSSSLGKDRKEDWPHRVLAIFLEDDPIKAEILGSKVDESDQQVGFPVSETYYREAIVSIFERLIISA